MLALTVNTCDVTALRAQADRSKPQPKPVGLPSTGGGEVLRQYLSHSAPFAHLRGTPSDGVPLGGHQGRVRSFRSTSSGGGPYPESLFWSPGSQERNAPTPGVRYPTDVSDATTGHRQPTTGGLTPSLEPQGGPVTLLVLGGSSLPLLKDPAVQRTLLPSGPGQWLSSHS